MIHLSLSILEEVLEHDGVLPTGAVPDVVLQVAAAIISGTLEQLQAGLVVGSNDTVEQMKLEMGDGIAVEGCQKGGAVAAMPQGTVDHNTHGGTVVVGIEIKKVDTAHKGAFGILAHESQLVLRIDVTDNAVGNILAQALA